MISTHALRKGWQRIVADALDTLRDWPWFDTLRTLRLRFREDRLGQVAGSLTFTTLIALVPLLTVALAIFTAFPMFSSFQDALQKYFLQSLVPDNIAKPVLGALNQFASKAHKLGSAGLIVLVVSALTLMMTIDRTLNAIWRVRKPRPIAQRVLVYWAAITLGPLVLGLSLSLTSYAISASRGLVGAMPGGVRLALDIVEFGLLAATMAGLFHYVPNTHVRWRHAAAGAVFVAAGFEVAKRVLGWYVSSVGSYSAVYGAFATAPIFLLWMYTGWVIVLLGAVIAAYAPSLQLHVVRQVDVPGQRFSLALAVLGVLAAARRSEQRGVDAMQIAAQLRIDPLQIEPILETLTQRDWLARLDEEGAQRFVLLCDPERTPAGPLVDSLLLQPDERVTPFRDRAGVDRLMLSELLA
ncbi:YihY family inner membrane protein [Ideonella sp.]|uniref:YihY family inner membrane protein n=1 Tax=Ideonella sp. TaxID=1929293 RepID=UPI002B463BB1|nr:YihY family inner membrane protein [Ideonella sp.]HJV71603.1 YihY family inner membrane protein [Ideonella sp.]